MTPLSDLSNIRVFLAEVAGFGNPHEPSEYEMWFRDLVTDKEGPRLSVDHDGTVEVKYFDED